MLLVIGLIIAFIGVLFFEKSNLESFAGAVVMGFGVVLILIAVVSNL